MKRLTSYLTTIFLCSCMTKSITLSVPAKKTVELDYPSYTFFALKAQNKSMENVVLKEVDFSQNDSVVMDTLRAASPKEILMNESMKLFFINSSDSSITLQLTLKNKKDVLSKPIVLRNSSTKMIPLFYANGTNLNIGPNSSATYWLREGLKLYFTEKGERFLLLEMDKKHLEKGTIDIVDELKKRKTELAL